MKFIKGVLSSLPYLLLSIAFYCLIFLVVFGIFKVIEIRAQSKVLACENEYLRGQIEWYHAQLEDKPYEETSNNTNGGTHE